LSLGNKKGPVPETSIWLLMASIARGVRGISAIPFGVLESGIQIQARGYLGPTHQRLAQHPGSLSRLCARPPGLNYSWGD
jgi:hypothetical protein